MAEERWDRQTKGGYDLFEVASTVQKAIRRGEEDTALYFAVEMFESGFDEYLWKRLRIIASEDVGLAEPNIAANIWALYEMHEEQKKKKDTKHVPERLFLTHAILLLCRAKKSRLVDWTLIAYWEGHGQEPRREIPDYAFDKHTARGRKLGRGEEHFFEEGARLENHHPQPAEEERKEAARSGKAKSRTPVYTSADSLQGFAPPKGRNSQHPSLF